MLYSLIERRGSGVRLYDGPELKLFISMVGAGAFLFVTWSTRLCFFDTVNRLPCLALRFLSSFYLFQYQNDTYRVPYFFIASLFFLYLRRRWFKSQSTGLHFVFFCGCLREGESCSVVGTTDECYFFFLFRHLD